jgi:hypothetical protein
MAWWGGRSGSGRDAGGRQRRFKCGYCWASLTVAQGRLVRVRGQMLYVHRHHPVRPGE